MKINIICTEQQACLIRDALENSYQELKKTSTDQGQLNAIYCNYAAKRLKVGLMCNDNIIEIQPIPIEEIPPGVTHNPNPASSTGKRPQILPEQKQVRRPQQDSILPHDKAQPKPKDKK